MPFKDPEARRQYQRAYRLREVFIKNRPKRLESSREWQRTHYVKKVSGQLGTIRYEARMAGYKSGFERTLAAFLEMRGIKFNYEDTKIPYTLERDYNPDFHLTHHHFFIEAKGLLDRESKAKMAAVRKQHPEIDIRFVFLDAQKKIPGSKQTHAQWADKNGFQWADREIPEEWLV